MSANATAINNEAYNKFLQRLQNKFDATVAYNILATLRNRRCIVGDPQFKLKVNDGRGFDFLFTSGLRRLTAADVDALQKVCPERMRSIKVDSQEQALVFTIQRKASTKPLPSVPVEYKGKHRVVSREIDFDAAGVTSVSDKGAIRRVVAAVYNIKRVIPFIGMVLESFSKPDHSNDESTEEEDTEPGFGLCFNKIPDFSADFLLYLQAEGGPTVTSVTYWFDSNILAVQFRHAETLANTRPPTEYRPRFSGPVSTIRKRGRV